MCLSLDRSNGNRGGHPTATYHDICFPQLEKAMPKLALTTTVFSRSNVAGKPIPPHFPFQYNLYPVSLAHAYGPFLVLSSGPKTYQEVGYNIYSQKTPGIWQSFHITSPSPSRGQRPIDIDDELLDF